MPATNFTKHLLGDAAANGTAWQLPATIYLALTTTVPTASVAGTEVTLGDYERKSFAQSGWTNDGAGSLSNTADIEFVEATANYDDDVVAVEAYSAATDGDRYWWIELTTAKTVTIGKTAKFLAGDLVLTIV